MSEPTSSLTFRDLIVDVARKMGVAYYGPNGDSTAQVPVDGHDLDQCETVVNKAIRMFIADAPPPNGWRWTRPVASVSLWGRLNPSQSNLISSVSYDAGTELTTLQAAPESFYPTMEEKPIVLTGVGSFTIHRVDSDSLIRVRGDASGAGPLGVTWSMDAKNTYTLPLSFSGMHTGEITYAAETNRGATPQWTDEATIRQWLQNTAENYGIPWWVAVRPMSTGQPRRRWELMVYPTPDEKLVVEFPYLLGFDRLIDLDEVPPAPFSHDETIRAACLAMVEQEVLNAQGPDWAYYRQVCLPNSYRIDSQSAPRRLGYFGNPQTYSGMQPIKAFRNYLYQRPVVRYNP